MKCYCYLSLLLCLGVSAGEVNVELNGEKLAETTIMIGVFNSADEFPNGSRFHEIKIESASTQPQTLINSLPAGRYALAVFVDKNKNGKLDTNFIGKPTELHGFSRNARRMFSSPSFDEAMFEVKETPQTLSIDLR